MKKVLETKTVRENYDAKSRRNNEEIVYLNPKSYSQLKKKNTVDEDQAKSRPHAKEKAENGSKKRDVSVFGRIETSRVKQTSQPLKTKTENRDKAIEDIATVKELLGRDVDPATLIGQLRSYFGVTAKQSK